MISSVVEIRDGWAQNPDVLVLLPEEPLRRSLAVLCQPGTPRELAERIAAVAATRGAMAAVRVMPDRDAAKTLDVARDTYEWLNEQRLTRRDTIIAVGGGALTDAAGFIAATYLRGIPAVLVPTTLVGAVDAALGGKTGVNVGGKNLVGVFRNPELVVIDPGILADLPEDVLTEGYAEAIKTGLIGDPALFELFEREDIPIGEVVRRAVAVKLRIVEADFTEQGNRAFLNYGHTIGHAIEIVGGMTHGHAVSVGMVAAGEASRITCGFADRDRHDAAIAASGLPLEAPGLDAAAVRDLMVLDKKRRGHQVTMTLLRGIGDPVVEDVDEATVTAALAAVGIQ